MSKNLQLLDAIKVPHSGENFQPPWLTFQMSNAAKFNSHIDIGYYFALCFYFHCSAVQTDLLSVIVLIADPPFSGF